MAKITVRPNGPFVVDGDDVTVVDLTGAVFEPAKRPFTLCRCGASQKRPFCDGAHNRIGFLAPDTATPGLLVPPLDTLPGRRSSRSRGGPPRLGTSIGGALRKGTDR